MLKAKELILADIRKNAKIFKISLKLMPFLKKKFQGFSNKLNTFSKNGIPALDEAPFFIVIAEKKGFPPVEKQSIAHCLENMWPMVTSLDMGLQLLSATGIMSKNKRFMDLLQLKKGEYEIEGCAVGYPKNTIERKKEPDLNHFVTWIKES